jgi:hypothetical protein
MRLEGAAGMVDYEATGLAIAAELRGIVRSGTVLNETYDKDQNCEIVYEVKALKLKKTAQTGYMD